MLVATLARGLLLTRRTLLLARALLLSTTLSLLGWTLLTLTGRPVLLLALGRTLLLLSLWWFLLLTLGRTLLLSLTRTWCLAFLSLARAAQLPGLTTAATLVLAALLSFFVSLFQAAQTDMTYYIHKFRFHLFLLAGGYIHSFKFFGDDILVIE